MVESFNGFSKWLNFGNHGVIAENDPEEQEGYRKPFSVSLLTGVSVPQ
jgi:hypothetical protein